MKTKGYFSMIIISIITISVFSGCATPTSYAGAGNSAYQAETNSKVIYQPRVDENMSYEVAEKTFGNILSGKLGSIGIKYYGMPRINNFARLDDLIRIFAGSNQTHRYYNNKKELDYIRFSSVPVKDGIIDLSPQLHVPLKDLKKEIKVEKGPGDYSNVVNAGLISFHFDKPDTAYKLADMLFTIKSLDQKNKIKDEENLARFETLAADYRALSIKPSMSEGQRKVIVQANTLNQKKDYPGTIDLYLKAIELDPVSYPEAYFNLALLYAQIERYHKAIFHMKQYMMLVPQARDARSAQDKIYEWEILDAGEIKHL
ncbi:MAG: tetratricopeptide repeat protein [Deltaproteobacteria bacterium]|nr:tetratricopeptide repeat protein [Deltaproteobacteria bacterium]